MSTASSGQQMTLSVWVGAHSRLAYMLSRVLQLEADVKHSLAKPKTVDEALAELESRVGTKGRRKFRSSCARWPKMRMRTCLMWSSK